jgi:oligopeptide transport system substrate-binding protein
VNTERPPFDDVRVRQALSMSIDRDMLSDRVLRLGEVPAYSTVTPFVEGYIPAHPPWFDLSFAQRQDRARTLLADAGFGPDNPLHFTYRYRESIKNRRAAIAVANMWRNIGVDVDLVNTEVAIHYDDLQSGNFEVGDAGWCPFVVKPEELLGLAHSDVAEFNYANYHGEAFEALYNEALTIADLDRRNALLSEAEVLLLADMPVIPTYYYVNKNLVGPHVQGWVDNPSNAHLTRWLSIDESLRPEQESFWDRITGLFS